MICVFILICNFYYIILGVFTLNLINLLCVILHLLVYCCCCLANVSIPGMGLTVPEFRPFFYINVADITALESELSYVACKSFSQEMD